MPVKLPMKPTLFTLVFGLLLCWQAVLPTAHAQETCNQRVSLNPLMAPFYHGVASGDPTSTSFLIWTRITPETPGDVSLSWEVATDTAFTNVVATGNGTATEAADYTLRAEVTGLQPDTWYYYRFSTGSETSIIGRSRTFPDGPVDRARIAVVSCADYQNGYYNAYNRIAARNDVDFVVHLGDYIYEYAAGSGDRQHEPETEIISLGDYRARYSQYRLDPDLIYLHQQYPMIAVWDDHESANNSWREGAENHTPGDEGDWEDRLDAAVQAYYEWLPIRQVDPNNQTRIYRNFTYGDLFELLMLDTRIIGRDEQVARDDNAAINDTSRTLLGQQQFDWVTDHLRNATATWKLLGQQVMFGPLGGDLPVLGYQIANPDQWDGYTPERQSLLDTLQTHSVDNMVVLTGDIHTSWAMDVPYDRDTYDSGTGAGSACVEFVTPSITSANTEVDIPAFIEGAIQSFNPHIKFTNFTNKGFYILDLTPTRAQADWFYVNTIAEPDTGLSWGAGYFAENGDNFIQEATAALDPPAQLPVPAPRAPANPVSRPEKAQPIMVGAYPNPFVNSFEVQLIVYRQVELAVEVFDLNGSKLYEKQLGRRAPGAHFIPLRLPNLPNGTYFVRIYAGEQVYTERMMKIKR